MIQSPPTKVALATYEDYNSDYNSGWDLGGDKEPDHIRWIKNAYFTEGESKETCPSQY